MNSDTLREIEAILMVAEQPVTAGALAHAFGLPVHEVHHALIDLGERYEAERRGFCLREAAGGWRYYSHPDCAGRVEQFVLEATNPRLSKAALEALAIIAYRQPVTRMQVTEIRGVSSDAVIRTLVLRGLVEPVGCDEGPGQATLYGTTQTFLERMHLGGLDELPPLADFVPEVPIADSYDAVLGGDTTKADPDLARRVQARIAALRRDLRDTSESSE